MGKRSPGKDEILDAIRRAAKELGRRPSRSAFIAHSGISEYQVLKYFPNWNNAVAAAGLEPDRSNVQLEDAVLLEDWGRLVRELRQIPTRTQYRQLGNIGASSFEHHFGPWSKMPDVFRQFAETRPDWSDVLALLPVTATSFKSPLSKSPTSETSEPQGYRQHRLPAKSVHSKLEGRPLYGNHIDFRGLRHEPVNENGVIFLFGIVARELGYSVEAVQQGFPDCEAKRMVAADKWQRVKIEFEYESRNFRDHGHPADGCDVIVCWRHNWAECPSHIEVLELSEVIKRLGKSDE
jgi:hypothetical protein